jgi:hypothetical protein
MAVDGERSIHVLSPFDGLREVGFVRSTPVVARRTPGVVVAKYEVLEIGVAAVTAAPDVVPVPQLGGTPKGIPSPPAVGTIPERRALVGGAGGLFQLRWKQCSRAQVLRRMRGSAGSGLRSVRCTECSRRQVLR